MGKITTVTCDQCGYDLTYTGNCEDYYLVLGTASKAPWFLKDGERGGALTDMVIHPPIDRTMVFCGIPCLAVWLAKDAPKAAEGYERMIKHREWLADKMKPPAAK